MLLIFPLWLGTAPALVKAFLEQVMCPGVAFSYQKHGAKKLLAGRSAHLVVTMGNAGLALPGILFQPWHKRIAAKRL